MNKLIIIIISILALNACHKVDESFEVASTVHDFMHEITKNWEISSLYNYISEQNVNDNIDHYEHIFAQAKQLGPYKECSFKSPQEAGATSIYMVVADCTFQNGQENILIVYEKIQDNMQILQFTFHSE